MQLTPYFFSMIPFFNSEKLHDELKLIELLPTRPKQRIRLDPIDVQDLHIEIQVVNKWSKNNSELVHLLLQNGMATFICNYEFLYEHYEELIFVDRSITAIDEKTLLFRNLIVLNLCENNIHTLSNIPPNCQELYLDFNQISSIKVQNIPHLQLIQLSISNNLLQNQQITQIKSQFPNLRSLNAANNLINDIRQLVSNLKQLTKLRILNTSQNPISMLKIYFQYITQTIQLRVFDGEKYQKPEPVKKAVQIPKPEVKEEVKVDKKEAKKDNKKGSKQPEPVKEDKPKTQPIKQEQKKQLTEEDFTKCRLHLNITNFQNFKGNCYDSSIFPPDYPAQKTQTTYWLEYSFFGRDQSTYNNRVRFDGATIVQNEPNRLTFSLDVVKDFPITVQNKSSFQKGLIVNVYLEQPQMEILQNGQFKPVKQGDIILANKLKVGEVFVDFRELLAKKQKQIMKLYYLWEPHICTRPFFQNPLPNEKHQINSRKQQFEQNLKKQEEEKLKKLQLEQANKNQNQKKGPKDAKKTEKKPQKKEIKQVATEKKPLEKSNYPLDDKIYCYLNDNKLYKAKKETLAIRVFIT